MITRHNDDDPRRIAFTFGNIFWTAQTSDGDGVVFALTPEALMELGGSAIATKEESLAIFQRQREAIHQAAARVYEQGPQDSAGFVYQIGPADLT